MGKRRAKGDEREGSRLYEGLMRDAGYETRRGTIAWGKRSKPPSPDGERRENEDGGLRSMTPITLSSSTFVGTEAQKSRYIERCILRR